jgi:hypothetical protein
MRAPERAAIVDEVLRRLAGGRPVADIGNWKYRVGADTIVNVRINIPTASDRTKFYFDITPNGLSADYVVWICGTADVFYTVPHEVIARLYDDPGHYRNLRNPANHPVHLNSETHEVGFARPGKRERIEDCFGATIGRSR